MVTALSAASMKVRASKSTHKTAALRAASMMLWASSKKGVMMASFSSRETAISLRSTQANRTIDPTIGRATIIGNLLKTTNRNKLGEVYHRNCRQIMKKLKASSTGSEPAAVSNRCSTHPLVTVTSVMVALPSATPLRDPLKSANHRLTGISLLACQPMHPCKIQLRALKDATVVRLSRKRKTCAARSRLATRVAILSSSSRASLNNAK